jgi:hypothetical protein
MVGWTFLWELRIGPRGTKVIITRNLFLSDNQSCLKVQANPAQFASQ